MHIIARPAIIAAKQRHPNAAAWLDSWWREAEDAIWARLDEVRQRYPGTDEVGQCLVFNACGNDYRLICRVSYANNWTNGTLLVKHFLTHAEHDKKKWSADCIPPEKPKAIGKPKKGKAP
jgi:mRNA interferase HigB